MNYNWVEDIVDMHRKFDVHEALAKLTPEQKKQFLAFRLDFIEEEFDETLKAFVNGNSEEIVDGLIDIIVVAIGTLDAFDIDCDKAWRQVMAANLAKKVGVKPSRPNPLGLPDLIKPEGWIGPDHSDNHGNLPEAFGFRKEEDEV